MAETFRVLVTGSRDAQPEHAEYIHAQLDAACAGFAPEQVTLVEGGARGADRIARAWAMQRGVACETYYAEWHVHGRAAGPRRNTYMVSLGADVCLAFPWGASVGTSDCASKADGAGIPVRWLPLDDVGEA